MKLIATALLVLVSLYTWRIFYGFHCGMLVIPTIFAVLVAIHAVDFQLAKRRAFAEYFFVNGTFLYRLFHRRFFTVLTAFIGALLTAVLFMLEFILWSNQIVLVLAADAIVLAMLYPLFKKWTLSSMMPVSRRIGLKHALSLLNTLLLLSTIFYLQLNEPVPTYIDKDISLSKTLENASSVIIADCSWIEIAVKLNAKKEAAGWWLMLTSTPYLKATSLRWVGWGLFLVSSMLGLWAFSRFLTQLYDIVVRIDE